jgi:uncharacterized membrane protein YdbT with pleckstrin-like domain
MQTFKPVIRWWSLVHPGLIAHFSETLEVHADRLMYRKGIFSEKEVVVPFSRVTNYSVDQNFFDRLFGVGNFTIETAGSVAPELVLNGYPYKLRDLLASSLNISS